MKPTRIRGWDGFELHSGDVSVGIVPAIGGRIMSLIFKGQELLYVDPSSAGRVYPVATWNDLSKAKKDLGFCVWGGDKTWIAPQTSWLEGVPPLDLDASSYRIDWEGSTAVMSSVACRETGLQVIRKISLENEKVFLSETLRNCSSAPVTKGLWNVTQVARPCHFSIPSLPGAFRDYHFEDASLPAYTHVLDPDLGILNIDCTRSDLFKIGGEPSKGELDILLNREGRSILWKKVFDHRPGAVYAHGSKVEVFNSAVSPYAEIELHAPLVTLRPDDEVTLNQYWQISACPSKT